jgi:glycosyltransferase
MSLNVSIITAVYNNAGTIGPCLESVSSQTHTDIEHIVIDGGSKDGTVDIVKNFGGNIAKFFSEADNGVYDAMNKGLKLVTGDIIGILNGDDFYPDPNILAKVAGAFDDPSVDSCYGDLVYVDRNDTSRTVRYWKAGPYNYRKFFWGWMPPHPTFFVRRAVYQKYGHFNLALGTAADYELILRFLVKHRIAATYIPEVLVKMRTGGISNVTLKNRLRANRMDRYAWKVNDLRPYPWTTYLKPARKIAQFFVCPLS